MHVKLRCLIKKPIKGFQLRLWFVSHNVDTFIQAIIIIEGRTSVGESIALVDDFQQIVLSDKCLTTLKSYFGEK